MPKRKRPVTDQERIRHQDDLIAGLALQTMLLQEEVDDHRRAKGQPLLRPDRSERVHVPSNAIAFPRR